MRVAAVFKISKMDIKLTRITPEMAEGFLAKNHSNRVVSRHRVNSYASDIKNGRWAFNPSPIVFSEKGELIDGQHRLLAVVSAGVPVEMMVMVNAPDSCKDTIDSGKPRTAADALTILGLGNSKNVAAIAAKILSYEQYGKVSVVGDHATFLKGVNASKAEIIEYSIENNEAIQMLYSKAIDLYDSSPIRIMSPSEIGFFFHALLPQEKANDFLTKVVSGVGLIEHSPELALRRVFEKTRITKDAHYGSQELSLMVFIAFEKSKKGESCDIIRIPKKQVKKVNQNEN